MLGMWPHRGRRLVIAVVAPALLMGGLLGCSAGGGTKLAAGERLPDGQWRGGSFVVSANEP
ncbi:MAG: hypothetical protein ACRDYF_08465, partial [Acidimicrobiia bacterium]